MFIFVAMGIVFRQSAKNLIVVAVGAVLGALTVWLSTKYITKQEYGFLSNFTNYAVILAQVLLLGFNNTLPVFIHRYVGDNGKIRALVTLCLVLPLIAAAIFAVVYYFSKETVLHHFQPEDIPFMRRYYMWLPVYTVLFIFMIVLEQYLSSQMKVAASAFMREVLLRVINIGLIILVAYQFIGFPKLFTGTILAYIVPILVFVLMASRTGGFGFSFGAGSFTRDEYKEIAGFSWYHFLFTVTLMLIASMDQVLLPFYDHNGFSSVAVYRVSVFLISFVYMPQKAMLPASFPPLARAFADNDMDKARDIFVRSSINTFIVTVFITVVIACNISNLMVIMNKGYADIIPLFFILCISALVNVATGMNDQVLSIAKYYKFNFYLSVVVILILFVMLRILIPRYGIYGAAWATTTAVIVFNVGKFAFVWSKLGMQPFSRGTIMLLVCGAAAFAAGYFFPHFFDQARHIYVRTFADVILRSVIIIIVFLVMLLWLKPSEDLEHYLRQVRTNKRLF